MIATEKHKNIPESKLEEALGQFQIEEGASASTVEMVCNFIEANNLRMAQPVGERAFPDADLKLLSNVAHVLTLCGRSVEAGNYGGEMTPVSDDGQMNFSGSTPGLSFSSGK